jgi:hypothetical protein
VLSFLGWRGGNTCNIKFTFLAFWGWGRAGFELRALHLQSRRPAARATPLVHFALVILEIGFQELFVQAGLEP